jgi:AbrB family looped-hinge helix DNA binding protein
MRVTSKGQVTIPQHIRDLLGIQPGAEVRFEVEGDAVKITKEADSDRGRELVDRMRGAARGGMSTDEIMALTRE